MRININSIVITLVGVALLTGLNGCLKEKYDGGRVQPTHTDKPISVIELAVATTSTANFCLKAVDNSDNDTIVNFVPVTLASGSAANEDIHVTVTLDNSLIPTYNDNNDPAAEDYDPMPTDKYSFVTTEVIIPAGSNTGFLQLRLVPSDFLNLTYAVGLRITSIKESGYTISGNFNTAVAAVTIKNEYDGSYTAVGARIRYFGGTEASGLRDSFPIGASYPYKTLNSNTINGQLGDAGSGFTVALEVVNTGTPPFIVNVKPDPATVGAGGSPDAIIPGTARGNSTYDPTTKTFTLHFGYLNASGALRQVNETMVKD